MDMDTHEIPAPKSRALESWALAILTLGILAPTAIAYTRRHPQTIGVFALNFLAGWTVIGWIAALIWAFIDTGRPTTTPAGYHWINNQWMWWNGTQWIVPMPTDSPTDTSGI